MATLVSSANNSSQPQLSSRMLNAFSNIRGGAYALTPSESTSATTTTSTTPPPPTTTTTTATATKSSATSGSEDDQTELKKRLKALMKLPENQVCSDCTERRPQWASLIVPPPGFTSSREDKTLPIGAFCCFECSGSHRRLGVHITFVRSISLDTWKEREVRAMENGGNTKVNALFEAKLKDFPSVERPTNRSDLRTRTTYIHDKYEHRKFYDPHALSALPALLARQSLLGKSSSKLLNDDDVSFSDLMTDKRKKQSFSEFGNISGKQKEQEQTVAKASRKSPYENLMDETESSTSSDDGSEGNEGSSGDGSGNGSGSKRENSLKEKKKKSSGADKSDDDDDNNDTGKKKKSKKKVKITCVQDLAKAMGVTVEDVARKVLGSKGTVAELEDMPFEEVMKLMSKSKAERLAAAAAARGRPVDRRTQLRRSRSKSRGRLMCDDNEDTKATEATEPSTDKPSSSLPAGTASESSGEQKTGTGPVPGEERRRRCRSKSRPRTSRTKSQLAEPAPKSKSPPESSNKSPTKSSTKSPTKSPSKRSSKLKEDSSSLPKISLDGSNHETNKDSATTRRGRQQEPPEKPRRSKSVGRRKRNSSSCDPMEDDQPKNRAGKDELPKGERSKDERSKDERSKDESSKDESSKDERPKDERPKDERPKGRLRRTRSGINTTEEQRVGELATEEKNSKLAAAAPRRGVRRIKSFDTPTPPSKEKVGKSSNKLSSKGTTAADNQQPKESTSTRRIVHRSQSALSSVTKDELMQLKQQAFERSKAKDQKQLGGKTWHAGEAPEPQGELKTPNAERGHSDLSSTLKRQSKSTSKSSKNKQ